MVITRIMTWRRIGYVSVCVFVCVYLCVGALPARRAYVYVIRHPNAFVYPTHTHTERESVRRTPSFSLAVRSNQNKCQEITWPKLDHALSTPEREGGRETERERATSNAISLPTDIHTNFPLREYFVSYSFSLDYEIVTYIHVYISMIFMKTFHVHMHIYYMHV